MVYAGVIIVYLLNLFFKKSPEERGRANEESPHGDSESFNDPFEEIRREILRKKEQRRELEEAEVERAMEADKVRETEAKKRTTEVDEPSQFQVHMEEQSQRIKEKQAEAERLKAHLQQIKNGRVKEGGNESRVPRASSAIVREKVRAVLGNKSDIKAALIAGEILSQPLALRREKSVASTRL